MKDTLPVSAQSFEAPSTFYASKNPTSEGEAEKSPDVSHSPSSSEPELEVEFLPMGLKLVLITASLMFAVFCVALDNTIIAVAIPRITDQFHNLNDVGWYASSYLLTSCSFQLPYGKLYAIFNAKLVFLSALFIFELGSLICAVSPDSLCLIVGRAIAGVGSAGIFSGALVTIAYTVPLHQRPSFFGLIGAMYGIASVAGPLVSFLAPKNNQH